MNEPEILARIEHLKNERHLIQSFLDTELYDNQQRYLQNHVDRMKEQFPEHWMFKND